MQNCDDRGRDKEAVNNGMNLRVISSVFPIAIIANLIGGVIIYAYLKDIQSVDLLQASVSSQSGLALIFLVLSVVTASTILVFYGPIYYLRMLVDVYYDAVEMPRSLPLYVFCIHMFWLVILGLSFWYDLSASSLPDCALNKAVAYFFENTLLMICVFIFIAIIFSFIVHKKNNFVTVGKTKNITKTIVCGFLVSLASLQSTVVIWVSALLIEPSLPVGAAKYIILVCFLLTIPSFFVGYMMLSSYKKSEDIVKSTKFASGIAFIFVVVICYLFPRQTIFPVGMAALRIASVYSVDLNDYQLIDINQKSIYDRVGFVVKNSDGVLTFQGYNRYTFGDAFLLCVKGYDPLSYEDNTLHTDCIRVLNGEVRRIVNTPTESGP